MNVDCIIIAIAHYIYLCTMCMQLKPALMPGKMLETAYGVLNILALFLVVYVIVTNFAYWKNILMIAVQMF